MIMTMLNEHHCSMMELINHNDNNQLKSLINLLKMILYKFSADIEIIILNL